ncbi:MAG: restriction endonuclease subunit S [Candidatus Paceibacterota bacterium]
MKYKLFYLIDDGINHGLFKLKVGGDRAKLIDDIYSKRKVNIVSNTTSNNGVESFIFNDDEGIKNCITIATRGNDYYACFQNNYTITIVRALLLYTDKFELNKYIGFYLCTLIRKNKYKSAYGRVLSGDRLKQEKILLPVDEDENPNWKYIEDITKKIYARIYCKFNTNSVLDKKIKLEVDKWKKFELNELFKIKGSKTTSLLELEEYGKGKYPYVTTQATNNGVEGFFDFYSEDGNILTADSAVLGYCSYQPLSFSASDHVEKLIPKFQMNKYIAMFLTTILNLEQYRYNYGRKCSQDRMKKISIKLPSKNRNPDFEYMETYIKSLSFSSSI